MGETTANTTPTMLATEEGKDNKIQLVTFELAGEHFGIDILSVQEISPMTRITRVPNAPDYVKGVINLRGKVIPIVDLRQKLELETAEPTNLSRVIVLYIDYKIIGIIVDKMNEVLSVDKKSIEANPVDSSSKLNKNYIIGVVNLETKLLIMLDLKKIFSN